MPLFHAIDRKRLIRSSEKRGSALLCTHPLHFRVERQRDAPCAKVVFHVPLAANCCLFAFLPSFVSGIWRTIHAPLRRCSPEIRNMKAITDNCELCSHNDNNLSFMQYCNRQRTADSIFAPVNSTWGVLDSRFGDGGRDRGVSRFYTHNTNLVSSFCTHTTLFKKNKKIFHRSVYFHRSA